MARHLAEIFGTEEDRVNCSWYFKVGCCRNGDQCNRLHNRPTSAQSLMLAHMYVHTEEGLKVAQDADWADEEYMDQQGHLENFHEEVFLEMANFGEVEDMVVVDNISDHLLGNVYVKFYEEEDAEKALAGMTGRFYHGKLIQVEFTPVSDFREARCRAWHELVNPCCNRGGYCNFMHIKHIPKSIKRRLARTMYEEHPAYIRRLKRAYGVGGGGGGGRGGGDRERGGERGGQRDGRERGGERAGGDRGADRDRRGGGGAGGGGGDRDRRGDRRDTRDDRGGGGDRDRRRDRDGDRRRDGGGDPGRDRDAENKRAMRQTSEERRAMIAQWNAEDDGGS